MPLLRVAVAVLALAALPLATACGGDDASGADSGSISFLIFGDPAEINAYRTLIKSFNEEVPDINVQLIEASDREDLIARLSTSLAGGCSARPLPHELPLLRPVRRP